MSILFDNLILSTEIHGMNAAAIQFVTEDMYVMANRNWLAEKTPSNGGSLRQLFNLIFTRKW